MERFINTENIKNYRLLLSDPDIEKDPFRRVMLERLLADELAKDAGSKAAMQPDGQIAHDPSKQRPNLSDAEYWRLMHPPKP